MGIIVMVIGRLKGYLQILVVTFNSLEGLPPMLWRYLNTCLPLVFWVGVFPVPCFSFPLFMLLQTMVLQEPYTCDVLVDKMANKIADTIADELEFNVDGV